MEEEEMMIDRSTLEGIFGEAAARRAKTVAELTEQIEAGGVRRR